LIEDVFAMIPNVEFFDRLRKDIYELNQKQTSFIDHFEKLKSKIHRVTNDFLAMRQNRGGEIVDENFTKEQQRALMSI